MNGETYTIEQPQAGAQNAFCASPADVAIYGGAAGGGKSIGLRNLSIKMRHFVEMVSSQAFRPSF
jgi:hypothetical protein